MANMDGDPLAGQGTKTDAKRSCIFTRNRKDSALTILNVMKKIIVSFICLATTAPLFAAVNDTSTTLPNEKAKVSYAIGMMLGENFFKRQGLDTNAIDMDYAAEGMKAVQTGATPLLSEDQMQQVIAAFRKEFVAKQQAQRAMEGAKNKAAGEAFLAANKNNPGVVTLPDGLQYIVITNGTGPIPTPDSTVKVNYRGTLIDGTEFDSSYKRGQPAQFPVRGVIHGWTEALEKMNVGSKWKLFVPSELAYGENVRPGSGIPPNAVLIFDVELLDATTPPAPPAPAPLTSDIIKVPSAAEMKNGAKIEVIKPEDAQKMQSATNSSH
jgi:FKBP-type peptidyl-prolyl cis-trans isomerase FklB